MSTLASMEGWPFEVAVSGTVDLPSNFNFTDTDGEDYDVVIFEGGTLDAGTKNETSFDVTVVAGPLKGKVMPRKLGAIEQVD